MLDLTRILAGPVATRFLAGCGADVLRIDPVDWNEPALAPEVTLGKRRARMDLRSRKGLKAFERLLAESDVLVHGYRCDALESLGLGPQRRRELNPGLVDVSRDAYGWSGPWATRRGFDSLVQMSCGIADTGMRVNAAGRPVPLPVQALDHATGYLLAAAVLKGLANVLDDGHGGSFRTSLARTALLLTNNCSSGECSGEPLAELMEQDFAASLEPTVWGSARRLKVPYAVDGVQLEWALPAGNLGDSVATW